MRWSDFQAQIPHLSGGDQERVREAFEMGKSSHAGQKRACGEDYFTHCFATATLLSNFNADADTICAAFLHDSVEDTSLTLKDIEERFGGGIARLVDGVTKLRQGELAPSPTLNGKIETLRKIFTLLQQDVRIMVIKLCDRLHNMQTIAFLEEEKQLSLAQETWDVYAKIADRLCMQDLRSELNGLCLAVLKREEYPTLLKRRDALFEEAGRAASMMQEVWKQKHIPLPSGLMIHPEAVRFAHLDGEGSLPLPLALVTGNEEDCYRMLYCLHAPFQRVLGSFEDFINSPTINGYRAVHTTVALADGTRVRCKIRTEEMHAYARQGVTLWCFDEKERKKRRGKLAWTLPLPTLTAETADRSEEFFEGLRSDILGETITIHGPEDRPFTVPAGATALDGAFHCFGKRALRILTLSVNGQEVPLQTPLTAGASLEATFGGEKHVSREWLSSVTTRHAASFIHRELAELPPQKKKNIGKELLQETFTRGKRGLIEEFQPFALEERLKFTGLRSLDDAYIAIAEGRRTPEEVTESLFAKPRQRIAREGPEKNRVVTFTTDADDIGALHSLIDVYEKYNVKLDDIRFWRIRGTSQRRWRMKVSMTPEEQKELLRDLQLKGARDASLYRRRTGTFRWAAVILLFVIWGIDPVLARLLIQTHDLSPIDLTIVRFWSLSGSTILLFLWSRAYQKIPEMRLSLRNASLWLSVLFLLSISLTTYLSLQTTLPSHYTIPMTAAGLLMITLVQRKRRWLLGLSWLLLVIGTTILIVSTPSWPPLGMFYTFLAIASFCGFSILSERYKSQEKVAARAAQYFLILSTLCALLTILLLPFSSVTSLHRNVIILMILFSLFVAGLPYYLYYQFLSHRETKFILRHSFLIIFVTVVGQALLLGHVTSSVLFAGLIVSIGALLPSSLPDEQEHPSVA